MEINPELVNERETATFNVKELTTIVDEGENNTLKRRENEKVYSEDPNMIDNLSLYNLSFDELNETLLKIAKYFEAKASKLNLPGQTFGSTQSLRSGHCRYIAFPAENPIALAYDVFMPAISNLATPELKEELLPLIKQQKIFGTYAQTELGHGTNIRKLETTATYDPKTEEFVLHSPTLTSIKCWPGGLGRSCNYAVVMAQLYTKNTCHGIHMFAVQLRNLDDHKPLPGITLGELGPRMGIQGTDNGFLRFDHFRIPRKNMLMRHAQVLKDGTYIKPKFQRANYGTMVFVRVIIVHFACTYLAQAMTIAIRYNAIRRQGNIEEDGPEVKILDYQTQQEKLFPQISLAYAMLITFQKLKQLYSEVVFENNADQLNEFHALACGMKAVASATCSEGVETCRRACGGLGYLHASRLPSLSTMAVAACTYEGDNTILLLQTARFLVKSMNLLREEKEIGVTVQYFKEPGKGKAQKSCLDEFVNIFEATSAKMTADISKKLAAAILQGEKPELAWQKNTIMLVRCATIHSKLFVMHSMQNFLFTTTLSKELRVVLEELFTLLSIQWILGDARAFIEYTDVSKEKLHQWESLIPVLLRNIRPNAVALVDAFDFCDAALQSVLGSYDGRVYERLHRYWAMLPANKRQNPGFVVEKAKL